MYMVWRMLSLESLTTRTLVPAGRSMTGWRYCCFIFLFHYDYLGKVVDMTEQVDERFLVAQDIHICVYLLAGFKFVGIIIGYVYVASQDIIEIVLQMLYSFWIFPVSVKKLRLLS